MFMTNLCNVCNGDMPVAPSLPSAVCVNTLRLALSPCPYKVDLRKQQQEHGYKEQK